MLLILQPSRRLSFLISSSSTIRLMGSKHLLKPTHVSASLPPQRFLHAPRLLSHVFSSKPISRIHPVLSLRTNGLSYTPVQHEEFELKQNPLVPTKGFPETVKLSRKMEELGIDIDSCLPGQYNRLLCPMCNGGDSMEKSLSLFIERNWDSARWICFRAKCGWKGSTKASADRKPLNGSLNPAIKPIPVIKPKKIIRKISEENLGLEPLNDELLAYFAERSISKETLERNFVMQKRGFGGQVEIAFTYRRKGELVSCKYRGVSKSFRVEKDTEKIFYGLDDIEGETDIIIVEGEMDKLAMAEAGFHNCVSVPLGAPASVSQNEVPPEDQDTKYQYLWNCKEYLKKASRIIIATDGDPPGKALAEELARRIGKERCWRVEWPRINEEEHFKDANEVLMILGSDALKEVLDNAELYPIRGLFNFKDYYNEIDAYYHRTHGCEFGISTGWKCLDSLYNSSSLQSSPRAATFVRHCPPPSTAAVRRRRPPLFSIAVDHRSVMAGTMSSSASNASGELNTEHNLALKAKSNDVGWEYAVRAAPPNPYKLKCLKCGHLISSGIHRVKQHIAHIRGDVAPCDQSSAEDKVKCLKAIEGVRTKRKIEGVRTKRKQKLILEKEVRDEVNIENEEIEMEEDGNETVKKPKYVGPMDRYASAIDPNKTILINKDVDNTVYKLRTQRVDEFLARWLYEAGVPFNAIERDSFKQFVQAVGQFGPGYRPPSQYKISGPLLKDEVQRTKKLMAKQEEEWKKVGCSIMTDAWSDRKEEV